jgi:FkbM family methyltransferase
LTSKHFYTTLLQKAGQVLRSRGLIALFGSVFRNIFYYPLLRIFRYLSALIFLIRKGFSVHFPIENATLLLQCRFSLWSLGYRFVTTSFALHSRVRSEPLLREIIYCILRSNIIQPRKGIVDIGCWIGDNAIVWAKLAPAGRVVFAIDPDEKNIRFVRRLSESNGLCKQLVLFTALCSDRFGREFYYEGSLSHASFSTDSSKIPAPSATETIDRLVGDHSKYQGIGLIHIDVEDMEFEVLLGAMRILSTDRPVVIYEQHLSRFDDRISALLKSLSYNIFMINEVIKENSPDCRNFLAIQMECSENIMSICNKLSFSPGSIIYPATLGSILIEIE